MMTELYHRKTFYIIIIYRIIREKQTLNNLCGLHFLIRNIQNKLQNKQGT